MEDDRWLKLQKKMVIMINNNTFKSTYYTISDLDNIFILCHKPV